MLQPFYDRVDHYITKLRQHGFDDYVTNLKDAMLAGMGSEVLGALAQEFSQARFKLGDGQAELIADADRLLEEINRIYRNRPKSKLGTILSCIRPQE